MTEWNSEVWVLHKWSYTVVLCMDVWCLKLKMAPLATLKLIKELMVYHQLHTKLACSKILKYWCNRSKEVYINIAICIYTTSSCVIKIIVF